MIRTEYDFRAGPTAYLIPDAGSLLLAEAADLRVYAENGCVFFVAGDADAAETGGFFVVESRRFANGAAAMEAAEAFVAPARA